MSDGRKRILSPLTGRKKRAAWIRLEKKIHRQKQDKIQGKQVGERETKEEWLEDFLYSKGAFYHLMKMTMMMRVIMKIRNSCSYRRVLLVVAAKTVSPILLQNLINDFAICKHQKHCSRTLLLVENVSHGFGNQNYIFQKGTFQQINL